MDFAATEDLGSRCCYCRGKGRRGGAEEEGGVRVGGGVYVCWGLGQMEVVLIWGGEDS